jgi:hypothetical protein
LADDRFEIVKPF